MRKEAGFITRIVCTPDGEVRGPGITIIDSKQDSTVVCSAHMEQEEVRFHREGRQLITQKHYTFVPREIFRYQVAGGKAQIVTRKTVDGERAFVENAGMRKTGDCFQGQLTFGIDKDEALYGLGQHENGYLNYRSVKEYLYQNNMKIPIPVLVSSKGYALLFDADCLMIYEEAGGEVSITFDAVDQMAYYLIAADCFDELISGIRTLTGKAVMLPRWAYGYIQSRERYRTSEEMLQTAAEFKKRSIPLSALVLDWKSWEEGKWGNKLVDKERFPDLSALTGQLHQDEIAFMVSVWPNMNKGCEDQQEMLEAGKLLANLSTYDAFDEEARALYWKQCQRELFAGGCDGWWCDSTEPFTPDWNGQEKKPEEERYQLAKQDMTRYFDARVANHYALMHARGIFENQRAVSPKRVVNLTRSGSVSIQQYGVILWSGDIMATWEVFCRQVAEGISISLSGIPYWTVDIGAFFAGSTQGFRRFNGVTKGDAPWFWQGLFEAGTADLGYRELYTRWLQFGTFLPMMRSHGTDTPREPWNFGDPGDVYYDTIVHYICQRYRLLPYTYSLAHRVEAEDYTILRSLMFDFPQDPAVREIAGQFMYGPAYLVCPVTSAMQYGPDNEVLNKRMEWSVYLPQAAGWYHEETKAFYPGGQSYTVAAPIRWQPVFIRAGAVIPLDSAGQKDGRADRIEVYEGDHGSFLYYQDNGSDYQYQDGAYATVGLSYNDAKKELMLQEQEGEYAAQAMFTIIFYRQDGTRKEQIIQYEGKALTCQLAEP